LKKLLDSIENLETPPETNVRIIIIENDSKNLAENIIKEFSLKSKFSIRYFLETRQGLSYARNRSVKEAYGSDFCCFVDDDQIVAQDWLAELVRCQKEFTADGIWGINPPIFNKNVPPYVRQFYKPEMYEYGTIVKKAYTNCLLLRKECLDKIDGPFDIRLNFSGGEDSCLTSLVSNMGYVIRFNPFAIAFEVIPNNRTTLIYILKRTYRISNARLFVNSLQNKRCSKLKALPRLILRFCYGLLIFIPFFIFSRADKLKGLIKMMNALGGFTFIFGKSNKFYK
jgi:succinoglycan biosynthesis protein ExoM